MYTTQTYISFFLFIFCWKIAHCWHQTILCKLKEESSLKTSHNLRATTSFYHFFSHLHFFPVDFFWFSLILTPSLFLSFNKHIIHIITLEATSLVAMPTPFFIFIHWTKTAAIWSTVGTLALFIFFITEMRWTGFSCSILK